MALESFDVAWVKLLFQFLILLIEDVCLSVGLVPYLYYFNLKTKHLVILPGRWVYLEIAENFSLGLGD